MYVLLARKCRRLSMQEATKRHNLSKKCKAFFWLACGMAIACILLSISQFVKVPLFTLEDESTLFHYLEWLQTPLFSFMMFTHLKFLSLTAKENIVSIHKNSILRNSVYTD